MAKTFVNVTNGNGKLGQAIASINRCYNFFHFSYNIIYIYFFYLGN